jgi:hypothetical protein
MVAVVDTPHFRHPFQFGRSGVITVEQDSPEEIFGCAEVALLYERGTRLGMPKFGLPDQAMLQKGANLSAIVAAVSEHDPRLAALADREDIIRKGVDRVRVKLKARDNG